MCGGSAHVLYDASGCGFAASTGEATNSNVLGACDPLQVRLPPARTVRTVSWTILVLHVSCERNRARGNHLRDIWMES